MDTTKARTDIQAPKDKMKLSASYLTLSFHISIKSWLPGPSVSIQAIESCSRYRIKSREVSSRISRNGSRRFSTPSQAGFSTRKSTSMSSRSVNQSGKTGAWNVGLSASSSVISQVHDLKRTNWVQNSRSIQQLRWHSSSVAGEDGEFMRFDLYK